MGAEPGMSNLWFAMAATCLWLLVLASWRLRTTAIGRSYLAFVGVSNLWAVSQVSAARAFLPDAIADPVTNVCAVLVGAAILRLGCQIGSDSPALPRSTEAARRRASGC